MRLISIERTGKSKTYFSCGRNFIRHDIVVTLQCEICERIVIRATTRSIKSLHCNHCNGGHNTVHGDSKHPIYRLYRAIKTRVGNPNIAQYKDYGGRGIKLCLEWRDYRVFKQWAIENGWAPGLNIDRINYDGNYEPNNCRFITKQQSARNRRGIQADPEMVLRMRIRFADGAMPLELAKEFGISVYAASKIRNHKTWKEVTL